jgi:tetratricopeptide (TPR) repeat protein
VAPAEPLPAPVVREHKLSPASQALVTQAQKQTSTGNYPVAAASIERALRIEPGNPQLWVELGKVRKAEGNYPQAENMARKALTMASGDTKSQSAAWQLIADSYRARGKNQEALDAQKRAGTSLR